MTKVSITAHDYEAVDLAQRISDHVAANEPETLVFERFGDRSTGKVVWYQVYADDEAFLTHAHNMGEPGLRVRSRSFCVRIAFCC